MIEYKDGDRVAVITLCGSKVEVSPYFEIKMNPSNGLIWSSDEFYHFGSRCNRRYLYQPERPLSVSQAPIAHLPAIHVYAREQDQAAAIEYLKACARVTLTKHLEELRELTNSRLEILKRIEI